ncbi:hypothetical protein TD95_003420 [Thielaviopsis punctulata]|uniref:TrmE-type G domain-containing protein n=1 Tax=Thielaviopsis punctulata TaxID=72032 RepID=A0A0F4Z9N6_9PEZI|nr:hypothetical protein TD95_003420 [Thielaviopsis punctulata]
MTAAAASSRLVFWPRLCWLSLARRGVVTQSFSRSFSMPRRPSVQPHRQALSTTPLRRWNSVFFSGDDDTVYALSTAPGRAGIAIVRISGPAALDVYRGLCPGQTQLKARHATLRTLHDPRPGYSAEILDAGAVVLYFPAPKTATGEDVLELHVHGGTATVKSVLAAIPRCRPPDSQAAGRLKIRYAEPGEFTKRAFINGRLDLAQVEGLSSVLSAETEQQRRAAVRGSSGVLGETYESWRNKLLLARGEIEALIDFSEDQHFDESPADLLRNVARYVRQLLASIKQHERASERSELLRSGIRIALVGPPNVGKSSLVNLIVGREASIVSSEAGTTRDIIEVSLDIRGYLCYFADTAGFRETTAGEEIAVGNIEMEGIRRARKKAEESDIVAAVASIEPHSESPTGFTIEFDAETLRLAAAAKSRMLIINKTESVTPEVYLDLVQGFLAKAYAIAPGLKGTEPIGISCAQAVADDMGYTDSLESEDSGNIQYLSNQLVAAFERMTSLPVEMQDLLGVTGRQRQLLEECRAHLQDFLAVSDPQSDVDAEGDIVIAAEYLRAAANCLAKITGRGESPDVEDVLGVIFENTE